jgi:large subunit ribosomal protein L21
MYAVVNTGGKQYKVQQGEVLRVEKLSGDVGSSVTFDRVLMFSDGENVSIGQPLLDGVSVEGHIVEQGKAKKIIVFKYKRRKRFRRKKGHRQEFTAIQIDSINAKGTKAAKGVEPKAEAKESEAPKAAPKKEPAAKAEAKKAAPKKEAAKKAVTPKAAPKKEPAKKAAPKKEPAKKAAPKKEPAKKAETKKAAPKKETAKKAPAKKAAPKKEDKK